MTKNTVVPFSIATADIRGNYPQCHTSRSYLNQPITTWRFCTGTQVTLSIQNSTELGIAVWPVPPTDPAVLGHDDNAWPVLPIPYIYPALLPHEVRSKLSQPPMWRATLTNLSASYIETLLDGHPTCWPIDLVDQIEYLATGRVIGHFVPPDSNTAIQSLQTFSVDNWGTKLGFGAPVDNSANYKYRPRLDSNVQQLCTATYKTCAGLGIQHLARYLVRWAYRLDTLLTESTNYQPIRALIYGLLGVRQHWTQQHFAPYLAENGGFLTPWEKRYEAGLYNILPTLRNPHAAAELTAFLELAREIDDFVQYAKYTGIADQYVDTLRVAALRLVPVLSRWYLPLNSVTADGQEPAKPQAETTESEAQPQEVGSDVTPVQRDSKKGKPKTKKKKEPKPAVTDDGPSETEKQEHPEDYQPATVEDLEGLSQLFK